MLGGVPDPLSTQKYTRLAARYGPAEATRILREGIGDPRERAFYERQNQLGAGKTARYGGMVENPFESPSMASLRQLSADPTAKLLAGQQEEEAGRDRYRKLDQFRRRAF